MTADRWRLIEDLFAQAIDRPHSERQTFLQQACQGDADLRREIETLLDADAPGQNLIELPLPESDMSGRRIGPYRLLRLIGHGGMGAVYLGVRDDDQYRKQVAIKLLKRGTDTDFDVEPVPPGEADSGESRTSFHRPATRRWRHR